MSPTDNALEERRKQTTLRLVKRTKNAGNKNPYVIMERLIEEVGQFYQLKQAKIVILWKSGWKPTKDDILTHAKIRKASEAEREIWGNKYELCLLLHRELWQSSAFSEEHREMDIFHELCHVVAEIDDKTGDQKKDDRGRLCWRLRNHPIQRFPEEIERYSLEQVLDLDESAKIAADDEASQADAIATENDADRPILQATEARKLESMPIETLQVHSTKISDRQIKSLSDAGFDTVGKLVAHMRSQADWWHREIKGIGKNTKAPIEDAVATVQTSTKRKSAKRSARNAYKNS